MCSVPPPPSSRPVDVSCLCHIMVRLFLHRYFCCRHYTLSQMSAYFCFMVFTTNAWARLDRSKDKCNWVMVVVDLSSMNAFKICDPHVTRAVNFYYLSISYYWFYPSLFFSSFFQILSFQCDSCDSKKYMKMCQKSLKFNFQVSLVLASCCKSWRIQPYVHA